MDLSFTDVELAFREEVRNFLALCLPADLRHKVLGHIRLKREEYVRWHKIVALKGWAGSSWPAEHGGPGWSVVQQHIWEEESALAGAPGIQPFGIKMVGPVIMAFGNEAQKNYYLPRILSCDDWWCQGYSEPGAGSDLAALSTSAVRLGDFYIVNGQKTWTTFAQHANLMFCLVRTNSTVRKQEGISFLLIDMQTPGVTVRPIMLLDGEHEVNEVFLENVRVPVTNLIGEENKGWTYAKYLLGHERSNIAALGNSKRELAFLKRFARKQQKGGRPLLDDAVFSAKVAAVEVDLLALEITLLRMLHQDKGMSNQGPEASILKIKGTDIQQKLTELMVEAAGPDAAPFDLTYLEGESPHSQSSNDEAAPLAAYYLNYRKTAIYGGSTEIQKNIISKIILGL